MEVGKEHSYDGVGGLGIDASLADALSRTLGDYLWSDQEN